MEEWYANEVLTAGQILKEEKEARKNAPQVIKDDIKSGKNPAKPSTRAFSTLARRQMEVTPSSGAGASQQVRTARLGGCGTSDLN